MDSDAVQLRPTHFVTDEWEFSKSILPAREKAGCLLFWLRSRKDIEEEKWIEWVRMVQIQVSPASHTRRIYFDDRYDYLLSEVGMNIIVPVGRIEEMRFQMILKPQDEVVTIDGFPKDIIEEKAIVGGKVRVGLTKGFKFIPGMHLAGAILSELVDIELNPWEFNLGSLRRVNIDFSGSLTSMPCWYLKRDGISNDFRVAMTIRKPKYIESVEGCATAAWLYDPGLLRKARVGTDKQTILIFK